MLFSQKNCHDLNEKMKKKLFWGGHARNLCIEPRLKVDLHNTVP